MACSSVILPLLLPFWTGNVGSCQVLEMGMGPKATKRGFYQGIQESPHPAPAHSRSNLRTHGGEEAADYLVITCLVPKANAWGPGKQGGHAWSPFPSLS